MFVDEVVDLLASDDKRETEHSPSRSGVVFPRLLVGLIVLICAEVFSGASIHIGLWNPWTWLVTFWLYFAHFFLFTTLAVHTGRTSLSSLYLWGVLFGLYESWITKVIWHGYGGDGKFVMGSIGPYGYSEISMVFIFHPVASFLIPLAVTCLLCPPLRQLFPDLAWLTGRTKGALVLQIYLVLSFATVMAMNSGGPLNLAGNLAFMLLVLWVISRPARSGLSAPDGRRIVVFGSKGFVGLCAYLILLYGVTYPLLRPDGLPSASIQRLTFVFYIWAIAGLWLHQRRQPLPAEMAGVDEWELKRIKVLFATLLVLALALSLFTGSPVLSLPVVFSFAVWTPLGFLLTVAALLKGARERTVNFATAGAGCARRGK